MVPGHARYEMPAVDGEALDLARPQGIGRRGVNTRVDVVGGWVERGSRLVTGVLCCVVLCVCVLCCVLSCVCVLCVVCVCVLCCVVVCVFFVLRCLVCCVC